MNVVLLGMSHRTAPVDLRERFAASELRGPLEKLVRASEVEEAVLLSTCNRVEVVVATRQPEAAALRLRRFVEHDLGGRASAAELDDALYEHRGPNAIRHVFRVSCSVDSMVVGEPQILGQVKEAYREAVDCGACGPVLRQDQALRCAAGAASGFPVLPHCACAGRVIPLRCLRS